MEYIRQLRILFIEANSHGKKDLFKPRFGNKSNIELHLQWPFCLLMVGRATCHGDGKEEINVIRYDAAQNF